MAAYVESLGGRIRNTNKFVHGRIFIVCYLICLLIFVYFGRKAMVPTGIPTDRHHRVACTWCRHVDAFCRWFSNKEQPVDSTRRCFVDLSPGASRTQAASQTNRSSFLYTESYRHHHHHHDRGVHKDIMTSMQTNSWSLCCETLTICCLLYTSPSPRD